MSSEEYPSLGEIESRCVNIVAKLFNAPLSGHENALGVSTVGSSEAIILAVLAAKRRWQKMRREQGKSTEKPNLVMNAAVQVRMMVNFVVIGKQKTKTLKRIAS